MPAVKNYLVLLLLLAPAYAIAQAQKYIQSVPLDMETTGVNKVLCMKNGNTMLFHFEINKELVVKVFDTTYKVKYTQKHLCRELDINALKEVTFKGLFGINNEAVLFIEQEHLSRYNLIRLRFSGKDGSLVEEKVIGESPGQSKRTRYYVMKNKEDDNYAIFFCTDIPQFKECKMNVTYYDGSNQPVREVALETDRKKYDGLEVVGAEWQPEGTCITIDLKTQLTNGTRHSIGADDALNTMAVVGHDVCFFFIPKNGAAAKSKVVDVSSNVYPFYSNFTFNPFAKSLNLLLLSYLEYTYKYGIDIQPGSEKASLFFNLDEDAMSLKYKWIKNEMANTYYKRQADSTKLFEGLPLKLFTNENGLSTAIYRSYVRYKNLESYERRVVCESFLENFCITQFDDDGNELWGIVLPCTQYFKSYRHYYFADELSRRWQDQILFGDLPEQVYGRQFLSQNIYSWHNNYYIIFNDYDKNFHNSMKSPGDTVFDFTNTNTFYYKLDRKKEVTKSYLFGEAARNEFKCSFIEGADFDEKRGVYATLVQRKRGDNVSLIMAWCHLD